MQNSSTLLETKAQNISISLLNARNEQHDLHFTRTIELHQHNKQNIVIHVKDTHVGEVCSTSKQFMFLKVPDQASFLGRASDLDHKGLSCYPHPMRKQSVG